MSLTQRALSLLALALALLALEGCGSSLQQPFDQMKNAPITMYRLQNYEPPPPPASASPPASLQLPPQIMDWVKQGAAMLPPGLLPPGLLPGQPAPQPAAANIQRFHGFPILGWMQLSNQSQHDEVIDILGHDGNFVVQHDNCMYAEFGVSIAQINAPPDDVLISMSCDQVQAFNFQWPYTKTGISGDTAKRIAAVVQKAFGGG